MFTNSAMLQRILQTLQNSGRPGGIPPMQYRPAPRQFTPSPAPDVPFMPAPQVGPQAIPLGGAPQPGMIGGLAGLGGFGPLGPGGGNTGPNVMPPPPGTGGPMVQPKAPNQMFGQMGLQMLQRARQQPMQFNPFQMLRGGR